MSNKADFVLLGNFVLLEVRDSGIRLLFAHLIFSLQFWFFEFDLHKFGPESVMILRCLIPAMSCLVMHKGGGALVWSCTSSRGEVYCAR